MAAYYEEPVERLVFATNSLRNNTLANDDDSIDDEVVTRFWHPHVTKIKRLDQEARKYSLCAEIERVPGKGARVRIGGEYGTWVDADEFLK